MTLGLLGRPFFKSFLRKKPILLDGKALKEEGGWI
jgi:hypothetical protein